jgi:DNA modification methylase
MPKAKSKKVTAVEPQAGQQIINLPGAGLTFEQHLHTHTPLGRPIPEWTGKVDNKIWQLFNGPAKETLRLLPSASVDCVVTSPPYFWLRDYKVEGQIGLEDSLDGYIAALTDVLSEVYRVLKSDGLLFINLGDTYYSGKGESQGVDRKSSKRRFGLRAVDKSGGMGIGLQRKSIIGVPWRVALKMCQQNWILRSPIIWHRMNCLPEAVKDRPSRGYEYIYMFAKSRYYFFDRDKLPKTGAQDVWEIAARAKQNTHQIDTAPFPDELVEQCLSVGCPTDGVVLDPFSGSGTTMRVALKTRRNAIGIELSPEYCKHTIKELTGSNSQ